MNSPPLIYADFQNADAQGRLRLNCAGTVTDLAGQKVQLREGLLLALYGDDASEQGAEQRLVVDGAVTFSSSEACWVAAIDWDNIRRESEAVDSGAKGTGMPLMTPVLGGEPGAAAKH